MKKLISLLIMISLIITIIPVFASNETDKNIENAILTVKSKISIPEEFNEFDSRINSNQGMKYYNLTWSSENGSVTVIINEKNDITSYRKNSYDYDYSQDVKFPKFSDEEVKNIAKEWLSKINPDWMIQLPDENIDYENYSNIKENLKSIVFKRIINGLTFDSNNVSVTVNTQTGEIDSMYSNWTYEDDFPDKENVISNYMALKIFKEKNPMEILYINDNDNENNAILVYRPTNPNYKINALTGNEFDEFQYLGYASNDELAEESLSDKLMASAGGAVPEPQLSPEEKENIDEYKNFLPEEELRKIAEGLENTYVKNSNFMEINYHEIQYFKDLSIHTAYLYYKNNEDNIDSYITLDAKTGELLSYTSSVYSNEEKISDSIFNKNANDFIKKYAPNEYSKVKVLNKESYSNDYKYYIQYKDDIPYYSNTITVSVNRNDGKIKSFRKRWNNSIVFENLNNIISNTEAQNVFVNNSKLKLSYELAQDGYDYKTEPMYKYESYPNYILAKTGEVYGESSGYKEDDLKIYPDDIENHYAKDIIKTLIDYDILTIGDDKKFRPDDYITNEEYINFISIFNQGVIPYPIEREFLFINMSMMNIKIEEDKLNDLTTRSDSVYYMIKALGYEKSAEIKGIYKTGFEDENEISEDKIGYTAIAKGLGIIKGDENNYFNPNQNLTRADAAIMIYNYLNR